jgi:hypothetical protein
MARTVVVLKAGTNGQLRIVAENSGAVLCRHCGGVMGDPFQGITISNGRFTFQHYGGSSWRWTAAYTFVYDRAKKDWFLFEDAASTFHSGDPETTETTTVIRRAETGDIRFSDFTTSYNTDSTTWTVKAAKTFFYQSPDLATKPRKAYLVKGDTFNGVRQFRNFIEGYFENSKGITSGFLLRKDVAPAGNTKAVQ